MSKPHSQTVRGTLSNPSTNFSSKTPPQLGDPVSLQRETHDSASPSQPETGSHLKGTEKSRQNQEDLPHSKKVRGTLAHADGPKLNKTMLGDPTSLKAETSESEIEMGAAKGEGSEQEEMKRAAEKRVGSKL